MSLRLCDVHNRVKYWQITFSYLTRKERLMQCHTPDNRGPIQIYFDVADKTVNYGKILMSDLRQLFIS